MTAPGNAFPKTSRLLRTSQFDKVFSPRKCASTGSLIVYAAPNDLAFSRLGLSIGRKCGDSVTRNHVKRLVREAFRTAGAALPAGFDFVVVARKTERPVTYGDVQPAFVKLAAEAARRWGKRCQE